MGKFDGILICTDLDGTLYKNDKSISERNREAIEYFKREGGSFTFVTGRLPYYSADAYNAVEPNVPFGCINGAGIYDGQNKRYIWNKQLSGEYLEIVRDVDESFPDAGIQIVCFEKTYFVKENSSTVRFRRLTGLPNYSCDYRDITEPVAKIIFSSDDEEMLLNIRSFIERHKHSDKFDFIRSERVMQEVLPKGASKGLLLEKIAEYLNIDVKKTIAIGDYDNDVSMLLAAGWGIAVSNASKAALDAADMVTVSNEEDAIARIIEDLDNGKYIV